MIRCATEDDLEQVYQLNLEAFAEHWSREGLEQAITNDGMDLYVCLVGDEVAGYILSQDVVDEVHIMQVAVATSYRQQGIAGKLSLYLILQKPKAHVFMLEVRASNTAAQKLYTKLGFKYVGRRVGYYIPDHEGGEREDALLMTLTTAAF